jgi:hypothetical protein
MLVALGAMISIISQGIETQAVMQVVAVFINPPTALAHPTNNSNNPKTSSKAE